MSKQIEDAMNVLREAMQDTELGSYAHSWHCNIAMSVYDECIMSGVSHKKAHRLGNASATRFMKLCFDVETTNETNMNRGG